MYTFISVSRCFWFEVREQESKLGECNLHVERIKMLSEPLRLSLTESQ